MAKLVVHDETVEVVAQSLYEEANEGDGRKVWGKESRAIKAVWMEAARGQIKEVMGDPGGEE